MTNDAVKITKIDAAHRQLCTAIRMYFSNDDLVSVHTLVCASREIYEKHCKMLNIERMFDYVKQSHPDHTDKDLWNIANGPRNFFKHPDDDGNLDATIELSDSDNRSMIFWATHDCAMLCKESQPHEIQIFNAWFLATQFPFSESKNGEYKTETQKIKRLFNHHFPGIRNSSLDVQRKWGLELLSKNDLFPTDDEN